MVLLGKASRSVVGDAWVRGEISRARKSPSQLVRVVDRNDAKDALLDAVSAGGGAESARHEAEVAGAREERGQAEERGGESRVGIAAGHD